MRPFSRNLARCVAATFLFAQAPAHASFADIGTPSQPWPLTQNGSVFFFYSSGTRTTAPSCATVQGRWVVSLANASGQSAMAIVMMAIGMHKRVWVNGTGTCSLWSDTETVDYISVED